MSLTRKYALIALFLALLSVTGPLRAAELKPWTILYYVVVDERTLKYELDAIKAVPQWISDESQCNCILQWDTHKDPAKLYVAGGKKWLEQDVQVSDNMGDALTFYRFLEWGMKNYPAEKYMVFIGGHGSGWEDKWGPGSISDRAYPTEWFRQQLLSRLGTSKGSSTFKTAGTKFSSFEFAGTKRSGLVADKDDSGTNYHDEYSEEEEGKGTAYDYDDNDCLTLQEIRVVLEEAQRRYNEGKKFEVLAYSSCWQMNLESVFEHQDLARYIVGCETVSYSGTKLFYSFLDDICKNPGIETRDLCDIVIKDYIHSTDSGKTIAWINTDGIKDIVSALDRIAIELLRVYRHPNNNNVDGSAFRNILFTDSDHHQGEERFIDMGTIAQNIKEGNTGFRPTGNMVRAANDMRAALNTHMKLWRREPYTKSKGTCISIYLPKKGSFLDQYWNHLQELRISKETHWDEFLKIVKGDGYDHVRALVEDMENMATRNDRLGEIREEMLRAPEGSAGHRIAQRQFEYLAFLQDHTIQAYADLFRMEVEDEDGSSMAQLVEAAKQLSSSARPVVNQFFGDIFACLRMSLRTIAHSDPEKAELIKGQIEEVQEILSQQADRPVVQQGE